MNDNKENIRFDENGHDRFMRAFLTLSVLPEHTGFLNRKSTLKQVQECMEILHITDQEPEETLLEEYEKLCVTYIQLSFSDNGYASGVLGLKKLKEEDVAFKIIDQIDRAVYRVPLQFGLQKQFEPLRNAMRSGFIRELRKGSKYWEQYFSA